MSSWSVIPEQGSILGIRTLLWLVRFLGYRVGYLLLPWIVLSQFFSNSTARKSSQEYLGKVGVLTPSHSFFQKLWLLYSHQLSFAVNAYDRLWFAQNRLDLFEVSIENHQLLSQVANAGKGAVILTSHIGSFEIMRSLSAHYNMEVIPVMYGASSKKFLTAMTKANPAYTQKIIFMDQDGVDVALQILAAVEQGKLVAIMADRIPPDSQKARTESVLFLNHPARFNLNPWILAASLRCPVIFAGGVRVGFRKYHVFAKQIGERIFKVSDRNGPSIQDGLASYVSELEVLCRKYPLQWFNFFEYWEAEV